jgi:O-antigen/teichoic acid export membrane protein
MAISETQHRLRIHGEDIWAKLKLSRWQLLSSVFSYLVVQADQIIVLFSLGSLSFAQYQISSVIASIPSLVMNQIIVSIGYPVLGKAQAGTEKFRLYVLFSLYLVVAVSIPAVIFTYFAAGTLVSIVFGQKWAVVPTVLPILFAANCMRPLMSIIEATFWTSGRFSWAPTMQMVRFVAFIVISPLIILEHELRVVAMLVLISNLMAVSASFYLLHRAKIFAWRIRIMHVMPLLLPALLVTGLLYPFAARHAAVTSHVTLKDGMEVVMLIFIAGVLYFLSAWKLTLWSVPRIRTLFPKVLS